MTFSRDIVLVDGKVSTDGIRKALGMLLLHSSIIVARPYHDNRRDAAYGVRHKQDETFVVYRRSHCRPIALTRVAGAQLQKDSKSWLCPPDPSKNYNIGCKIHRNGTGTWFFSEDIFAEWISKDSLLWIYGKRNVFTKRLTTTLIHSHHVAGSGKSILLYVLSHSPRL